MDTLLLWGAENLSCDGGCPFSFLDEIVGGQEEAAGVVGPVQAVHIRPWRGWGRAA